MLSDGDPVNHQDGKTVLEVAREASQKPVVELFMKWKKDKSVRAAHSCNGHSAVCLTCELVPSAWDA